LLTLITVDTKRNDYKQFENSDILTGGDIDGEEKEEEIN